MLELVFPVHRRGLEGKMSLDREEPEEHEVREMSNVGMMILPDGCDRGGRMIMVSLLDCGYHAQGMAIRRGDHDSWARLRTREMRYP